MRLRIGDRQYAGKSIDLRCRMGHCSRPPADGESTASSAFTVSSASTASTTSASSAASTAPTESAESTGSAESVEAAESAESAGSAESARSAESAESAGSAESVASPVDRLTDATLASRIATAIGVDESVPNDGTGCEVTIEVDCPSPARRQETLRKHPCEESFRTVLAAAARSRGMTTTFDEAIADRREALREHAVPTVDLDSARERLAAATGDEERLRERVAALRGELSAYRDLDADETGAQQKLSEATRELSKAETERIAAEQALDRAVERARDARDARDDRLTLEDELANLERDARRELAREIYPAVRGALRAIPGGDPDRAGDSPERFAGDVATGALAAVRVASFDAPVVLGPSLDRFESATAAREVLDCPVIRV